MLKEDWFFLTNGLAYSSNKGLFHQVMLKKPQIFMDKQSSLFITKRFISLRDVEKIRDFCGQTV
jgi:hypothetical protein